MQYRWKEKQFAQKSIFYEIKHFPLVETIKWQEKFSPSSSTTTTTKGATAEEAATMTTAATTTTTAAATATETTTTAAAAAAATEAEEAPTATGRQLKRPQKH